MNFLSNLTVLSLSHQMSSASPCFINPLILMNQKISFHYGRFHNFFSPFFYSPKQNINLYLSMCTFEKFLDRAVQINQIHYVNKTFFNFFTTVQLNSEGTIIDNCKFCGINSLNLKGGAILSIGKLKVKNSAFLRIKSQGYGVVASSSSMSIENTIFYKNVALFTSSIFSESENNESFHIKCNSFSKCRSKICLGVIYKPLPSNDFKYSYNNISVNTVNGFYGSIIVNKSETYFSYSVISNVKKSKYNCGIYINVNYLTKIESCVFCNLSRISTDSNFGIALQIDISDAPSFISNCIFGKMEVSAPILFCSLNNVLVSNSCFFQKREEFAYLAFFDFIDCTYDKACPIENKINLFTIINESKNETNYLKSFPEIRNEFEYETYLHLPFMLALILVVLYFLLNNFNYLFYNMFLGKKIN